MSLLTAKFHKVLCNFVSQKKSKFGLKNKSPVFMPIETIISMNPYNLYDIGDESFTTNSFQTIIQFDKWPPNEC